MNRCIAALVVSDRKSRFLDEARAEPGRLLIDATSYLSAAKAPGRDFWSKNIATLKSTVARLR